jgi:hypothetical protein
MEPRAHLALHPHGLDRLELDSRGLQRFDFPNDAMPSRELKLCRFHGRLMTHNSDSYPFPHFSCMPGLGVCHVPEDHVWHGRGCLLDGTIEEIKRKCKQMEMLDTCVAGPSQSRYKTDQGGRWDCLSRERVLLRNAGHVGPYASLTCLLILMTSLPHCFYCADCSIVLMPYCSSRLVQCYCLTSLLFQFPIVLGHLLIVHPSLVEQLAQVV